MYRYPVFVDTPSQWHFADAPRRHQRPSRPAKVNPYSSSAYLPAEYDEEYVREAARQARAEQVRAAQELESQRLKQEYSNMLRQQEQQQEYRRRASQQQTSFDEEEQFEAPYGYAQRYGPQFRQQVEAERERQLRARELLRQRQLQEQKYLEEQRQEELRRRQQEQAFVQYLRQLQEQQQQQQQQQQQAQNPFRQTRSDDEEDDDAMDVSDEEYPYFFHQQQQQQRNGLRRSRSLSPKRGATPVAFQKVPVSVSVPVQVQPQQKTLPAPPKMTQEEAVLALQTAIRGFLVRRLEVLPKLKEINSVRQTVNGVHQKYEGVIPFWQELATRAAQFRSGEVRAVFALPEKRDAQQVSLYEEEILRALISLDNISTGGSDLVREARKQVVREIQSVLSQLDAAKSTIKLLPTLEAEFKRAVLPSEPETVVPSTPMDVDVPTAEVTPADQMETEIASEAVQELPTLNEISQSDIDLVLRTLAANGLSLEDLRPSATPKSISFSTLSL